MAEAGTKEGRTQPDNGDETPSRRLQSPGAAHDELTTGFNELSAALTTYSVYAVYAVIGANWAIHGTAQTLLSNQWAKWSMVIAIGYVAVHLTCVGCMTLLYRRRCDYADHDREALGPRVREQCSARLAVAIHPSDSAIRRHHACLSCPRPAGKRGVADREHARQLRTFFRLVVRAHVLSLRPAIFGAWNRSSYAPSATSSKTGTRSRAGAKAAAGSRPAT